MSIRSFGGAAARLLFAAFAIFTFSAAAEAAVYLSYVASNGNDANPCSVVTAPCKTLSRAVAVTSANGTVRVLTALNNGVVINKSITISGDGAPIVGYIVISGAGIKVTLRGLQLSGVGIAANGIRIDSAAAVHIEDSTVERYTDAGIKLSATTATELFVSDTVSRDNNFGLYVSDTSAQVTIEDSRFVNNSSYGVYLQAAKQSIIRSVASGNGIGFRLYSGSADITETTAADNSGGFIFSGSATATLAFSVVRGNGTGLELSSGNSVSITDCVIVSNTNYAIYNLGAVYTRENNTLGGNVSGNAAIPFNAY